MIGVSNVRVKISGLKVRSFQPEHEEMGWLDLVILAVPSWVELSSLLGW